MKVLIIYGSTTGNTENMAAMIQRLLDESGVETEMKNVTDASIGDLTAGYDVVLLGCPAYGDDTIELQDDFDDYYQLLDDLDLNGQKIAVFAPGDSSYEHFCGSVDKLEKKMEALGGKIFIDGLKVDGDYSDSESEITAWAKAVAAG